MDQKKRDRLVASLSTEAEPQVVPIHVFFDGNDDLGSIGCNLPEHPGIEAFRATLGRVGGRPDVEAIYAQIAELDTGDHSWPFADTVLVFGTITAQDLTKELSALEPDEVTSSEEFGTSSFVHLGHQASPLVVWWD